MSHPYDEDSLESSTMDLLESLGWDTANGYEEGHHPTEVSGRDNLGQVLLPKRLLDAVLRLNPELPPGAAETAIEALATDRSVMTPVRANEDLYRLLRDGVRVAVDDGDGGETVETIRIVDWDDPDANDWYAVQQFWVSGDLGKKRPDVVGFVNGIPLVLIELKASHVNLEAGYSGNISDYKDTIPQLFWPNGMIIVSNGSDARVGSVSAA